MDGLTEGGLQCIAEFVLSLIEEVDALDAKNEEKCRKIFREIFSVGFQTTLKLTFDYDPSSKLPASFNRALERNVSKFSQPEQDLCKTLYGVEVACAKPANTFVETTRAPDSAMVSRDLGWIRRLLGREKLETDDEKKIRKKLLDPVFSQGLIQVSGDLRTNFLRELRTNLAKFSADNQKAICHGVDKLDQELMKCLDQLGTELSKWLDFAKKENWPPICVSRLAKLLKSILDSPFRVAYQNLPPHADSAHCKENFLLILAICLSHASKKFDNEEVRNLSKQLRDQFFLVNIHGDLMDKWLKTRIDVANEEFLKSAHKVSSKPDSHSTFLARLQLVLPPGKWTSLEDWTLERELVTLFGEPGVTVQHAVSPQSLAKAVTILGVPENIHVFDTIARMPTTREEKRAEARNLEEKFRRILESYPPKLPFYPGPHGAYKFGRLDIILQAVDNGKLRVSFGDINGEWKEMDADQFIQEYGPREAPGAAYTALHGQPPPLTLDQRLLAAVQNTSMAGTAPPPLLTGGPLGGNHVTPASAGIDGIGVLNGTNPAHAAGAAPPRVEHTEGGTHIASAVIPTPQAYAYAPPNSGQPAYAYAPVPSSAPAQTQAQGFAPAPASAPAPAQHYQVSSAPPPASSHVGTGGNAYINSSAVGGPNNYPSNAAGGSTTNSSAPPPSMVFPQHAAVPHHARTNSSTPSSVSVSSGTLLAPNPTTGTSAATAASHGTAKAHSYAARRYTPELNSNSTHHNQSRAPSPQVKAKSCFPHMPETSTSAASELPRPLSYLSPISDEDSSEPENMVVKNPPPPAPPRAVKAAPSKSTPEDYKAASTLPPPPSSSTESAPLIPRRPPTYIPLLPEKRSAGEESAPRPRIPTIFPTPRPTGRPPAVEKSSSYNISGNQQRPQQQQQQHAGAGTLAKGTHKTPRPHADTQESKRFTTSLKDTFVRAQHNASDPYEGYGSATNSKPTDDARDAPYDPSAPSTSAPSTSTPRTIPSHPKPPAGSSSYGPSKETRKNRPKAAAAETAENTGPYSKHTKSGAYDQHHRDQGSNSKKSPHAAPSSKPWASAGAGSSSSSYKEGNNKNDLLKNNKGEQPYTTRSSGAQHQHSTGTLKRSPSVKHRGLHASTASYKIPNGEEEYTSKNAPKAPTVPHASPSTRHGQHNRSSGGGQQHYNDYDETEGQAGSHPEGSSYKPSKDGNSHAAIRRFKPKSAADAKGPYAAFSLPTDTESKKSPPRLTTVPSNHHAGISPKAVNQPTGLNALRPLPGRTANGPSSPPAVFENSNNVGYGHGYGQQYVQEYTLHQPYDARKVAAERAAQAPVNYDDL